MESFLEQFLKTFWNELRDEGQRVVKIKVFSAALRALNGVRRLVLLQYCLLVLCFLVAAGIFGIAWVVFENIQRGNGLAFTLQLKFLLAEVAITSGLLYLTIREKTWIKAMDLDRHIDELLSSQRTESASDSTMSRDEIARLVADVVETKLAVLESAENRASRTAKPKKTA